MSALLGLWLTAALAAASPSPSVAPASPSPSVAPASPSPSPSPTASPTPPVTLGASFSGYGFYTNAVPGLNTQVSNALLNVSAGTGKLRLSATAGAYGFPTLGFPILPVDAPGANTNLYSALPLAALQYSFDSHWSLAIGKFAALLGQESPFTYQNLNIQRGIGWEMEPTISRGVQGAYVNGTWSATLQENDAYYSGGNRAIEGLVGWAPSSNTNLQFAFIIPGSNVPGNPTTSVGNKAEYDLMYTRQIGKLQVLPYLLFVNSPASTILGYSRDETATAAVLLGAYTFSSQWSLAFRYEAAWNGSAAGDMSPNADLIGFGPGGTVTTQTVTPAYRFGNGGLLRLEYSHFQNAAISQNRVGFELGVIR